MRKIFGYIIIGDWGTLGLSPYAKPDEFNILWTNHLTLFHTRKRAQAAIKATKRFVEVNGYSWPVKSFFIRPVDHVTHS